MERWQNRVAVVTGASSGIGAAISRQLIEAGLIVVGLARRKERLDAFHQQLDTNRNLNSQTNQIRFHAIKCDVADLSAVNEAFDWIEQHVGGVDILINNAGMLSAGQLATKDIAVMQQVLQTNVMGVVQCTQRAYKSMKIRNFDGHIVIINSIVGHILFNPLPGSMQELNMYPATKHAVTAITELLRQEFRDFGTKIKITSISPGLVDTDLVPNSYKRLPMLQPDDVASSVMFVIATPPHVQIHELTIKPLGEPF